MALQLYNEEYYLFHFFIWTFQVAPAWTRSTCRIKKNKTLV